MNLPNILTALRFLLSFVMVFFIFKDEGRWAWVALVLFVLGSITDYADGWIARKYKLTSVFGALMDPIADKTLTLCAFISFWKLDLLPGLWVAVVATRDITVTGFRLFNLGKGDPSASASGKGKTIFQMMYIIGVLGFLSAYQSPYWRAEWEAPSFMAVRGGMIVIVLLTVWSGFEVFRRGLRNSS